MHVSELITNCTVRIDSYAGEKLLGTGTGFFCRLHEENNKALDALVTNKHVVKGAASIRFLATVKEASGEIIYLREEIKLTKQSLLMHPNPEIDACAILVSHIFNKYQEQGRSLQHSYISKDVIATEKDFAEILPMEEVTMIGYPIGLMDKINNGAIARRGIIASNPAKNYDGKPEFLIDMACMPGSSGSPVFLFNTGAYSTRTAMVMGTRVKLLGLLWGGPERKVTGEIVVVPAPMQERPIAVTQIPISLGFVIKATELQAIFKLAENLFQVISLLNQSGKPSD